MGDSDDVLWQKFLSGDTLVYEYIYRQHVQKLFLYGITITKDEELVRDCIQDVFTRIFEKRQSLSKTDNIRLYLIAALRNAILNAIRRQNTYNTFKNTLEIEELTEEDTALDKMISIEDEVEKTKLFNYLLSMLSERQKEIVYYRFVEGMRLEEISRLLNIDYHSVANVIQRALKKMRSFYKKSD